MAKKQAVRELSAHGSIDLMSGWNWYSFLLHRNYQSLKGHNPRYLCIAARFCVLGFITCMALAILLIILSIVLRIVLLLAFR